MRRVEKTKNKPRIYIMERRSGVPIHDRELRSRKPIMKD